MMTWSQSCLINDLAAQVGADQEGSAIKESKDIPGDTARRSILARKAEEAARRADYHSDSVGEWLDLMADSMLWILRAAGVSGMDIGAELRRKVGSE